MKTTGRRTKITVSADGSGIVSQAGGLLLAYRALEEPITRWPRIALGVVAVAILQNATDCYWHLG